MKVGRLRDEAQALGFTPQDQVRWLSPRQLLRTAGKVAISSLLAGYADRREVQAALPAAALDLSGGAAGPDAAGAGPDGSAGPDGDGLWIDVVADLGDGFDATFSVAWVLSRPELQVGGHHLRRGDVLVLGGDEVYPTASAAGYEDRTTGPYRCALPAEGDDAPDRRPVLLAVPGNHDWYDGLTSFLRIFTQRRSIGGWRTRQTRSYFAARLPGGWWLVGLDTQLGSYIDDPQMGYFREHLSARLADGDGVIVCAPTPAWVHPGWGDADAFNSLHYFERRIVEEYHDPETGFSRPTGASVRLWLSGDLHHYARYEEVPAAQEPPPDEIEGGAARQLITCGLGGSYLLGTADLPEVLAVPPPGSRMSGRSASSRFRRACAWPTPERSRRLALGAFAPTRRGIVARNPGLWRSMGLAHAAGLPLLAALLGGEHGRGPGEALRLGAPSDVLGLAGRLGVWILAAVALACLVPVVRGQRPRTPPTWVGGTVLQLVVALGTLAGALAVPWPEWGGWLVTGAAALGAFVVAGVVGCYTLALSFALSRSRSVREWLFSAQSIEDGKGFLRLHLDAAGLLTIYPVLVERVCHDWELVELGRVAEGRQVRRRPVPATGSAPQPQLFEEPVTVRRDVRRGGRTHP